MENIKIEDVDFPASYSAADKAAIKAQGKYLKIIRADLILLILGALILVYIYPADVNRYVAIVSTLLFAGSIWATLILQKNRYEKIWYGARAIAESVKTLTWRYMTCAEPFMVSTDINKLNDVFLGELNNVLSKREELFWSINEEAGLAPLITEKMKEVRGLNTEQRKSLYLEQRINDQRRWYKNKSVYNKKSESRWYGWMIFSQLLAFAASIYIIAVPGSPVNLTGVFAALAAAFLAWMQTRQHQELAQSYSIAAYELDMIAAKADRILTDDELSVFVSDAENAISREHTLWIARRDKIT